MVTIDYDGVSTHLMIILMIRLGIFWLSRSFPSTPDMGTVSKKNWSNIHPCWDQCNGQRFLNELGAVTLILLHICSMISFGGFLEECLPCLLPPKLQLRGLVFERKLVTIERV